MKKIETKLKYDTLFLIISDTFNFKLNVHFLLLFLLYRNVYEWQSIVLY